MAESAYEDGYRIYTTITRKVQQAAQVMRTVAATTTCATAIAARQMCCGKWASRRGITTRITDTLKALRNLWSAAACRSHQRQSSASDGEMPADGSTVALSMEGVRWARPYRSDTQQGPTPRKVTDVLQTGQQIWVRQVGDAWWLAQVPEVNSALVSI